MPPPQDRPMVLVIDDDRRMWRVYSHELGKEGYSTCTGDGRDGFDRIWDQAFRVVVIDVRLASVDGLDLLSSLASRFPDIPIVVHSAAKLEWNEFRTWAADAYVPKSGDLSELKRTIRSVLSERARTGPPSTELLEERESVRPLAQDVETSGRRAFFVALAE